MYAAVHIPAITLSGSIDLLHAAQGFAPDVEKVNQTTVVFSIAGLSRLIGNAEMIASEIARRLHERGLDGNIGIARTRDLAIVAAQYRRGVSLVMPGAELEWLGGLPVANLPLTENTIQVFSLWGIQNLEQFCALPQAGVSERLGTDAALLWRLAKGEWNQPWLFLGSRNAMKNVLPLTFHSTTWNHCSSC